MDLDYFPDRIVNHMMNQKWLNENMSQDHSIKKLFEIINK
jgi:hypothetical protein